MARPEETATDAHAKWLLQHRSRWPLCICALFSKEKGNVRWKVDAKSGDLWLWSVGRDGRDESAQCDVSHPGSVNAWRDKNILFHIQAAAKKEAQKP